MNVLLLCDDLWHPAEVIERGLASMDREDLGFDIVRTAKDILTPEFVQRYDVIVNCHGPEINGANHYPWFEDGVTEFAGEEFRRYVENGGGLVVVHAGLTLHRAEQPQPAYNDVTGSYFLSHPPRCMTHNTITFRNAITKGVEDFSVRDEHYQLAYTTTDIEPFMTTTSDSGGITTSGYSRFYGKGRVVVLAPGHTLSVWENPNFQKLIKNSVRWAADCYTKIPVIE